MSLSKLRCIYGQNSPKTCHFCEQENFYCELKNRRRIISISILSLKKLQLNRAQAFETYRSHAGSCVSSDTYNIYKCYTARECFFLHHILLTGFGNRIFGFCRFCFTQICTTYEHQHKYITHP